VALRRPEGFGELRIGVASEGWERRRGKRKRIPARQEGKRCKNGGKKSQIKTKKGGDLKGKVAMVPLFQRKKRKGKKKRLSRSVRKEREMQKLSRKGRGNTERIGKGMYKKKKEKPDSF